jgi:hypothetical protein
MSEEELSRIEKTMNLLMLSALRGLGQKDQIDLLERSGFGQGDIAALVGSTAKAVSVRLAEIRKARKDAKTNRKR